MLCDMDDRRHLTPRQRQVLALYAQGLQRRSIAVTMKISVGTVRVHREDILANLGVKTIVQAAVIGLVRGEITIDKDETVSIGSPKAPSLQAA